jgi:outer membrane protein assembly factor BamB
MRRTATVVVLMAALPLLAAPSAEEWWAAVRKGDAAAVTKLLEQGADVNARTGYGATALTFAADKGHRDVVRTLIEHKADVNAKDTFYQMPPLTWAVYRGHAAVARALVEAGADGADGALSMAAATGNVAVVRELLATGKYKPEALDGAMRATPAGNAAVAELLTKAGAKEKPREAAKPKDDAPKKDPDPEQPPAPADEGPLVPVTEPKPWPQFRGPAASGAADGQRPPLTWDGPAGKHVRWKTPIPGLGHSCPVVWEDRVFVTTAVSGDPKTVLRTGQYGDVDSVNDTTEHVWKVFCLEKPSGQVLWEQTAHRGVPKVKRHLKGSHANPTPATDGRHLVVSFGSEGLYCYTFDGQLKWRRDLGTLDSSWFFDPEYQWGFGSSPVLWRGLVFVQCDVGKGSFLAALRVEDGKDAWRTEREEVPSWGTPSVVEGPERAELVTNATKFARGYDPLTGKELWRLGRNSEITVPTPIYAQGLIFVTSGYRPVQPIYAIKPGANGDLTLKEKEETNASITWSKSRGGPYMPTPLAYGEHLYTCSNAGVLTCYEAQTGKQLYAQRLGGRNGYTASPVAADGRLYLTDEDGATVVVKAGPKFEKLATNPLGEACLATPAVSDGMLFIRTQHHLWALGRTK